MGLCMCIVNVQVVDMSFFRLASRQPSCVARSWSVGSVGAHLWLGTLSDTLLLTEPQVGAVRAQENISRQYGKKESTLWHISRCLRRAKFWSWMSALVQSPLKLQSFYLLFILWLVFGILCGLRPLLTWIYPVIRVLLHAFISTSALFGPGRGSCVVCRCVVAQCWCFLHDWCACWSELPRCFCWGDRQMNSSSCCVFQSTLELWTADVTKERGRFVESELQPQKFDLGSHLGAWEPCVFFLMQAYNVEGSLVVGRERACHTSRGVCLGKKVDKALFLSSSAWKLLAYCIGIVGRSSFSSITAKKNKKNPTSLRSWLQPKMFYSFYKKL